MCSALDNCARRHTKEQHSTLDLLLHFSTARITTWKQAALTFVHTEQYQLLSLPSLAIADAALLDCEPGCVDRPRIHSQLPPTPPLPLHVPTETRPVERGSKPAATSLDCTHCWLQDRTLRT